MRRQSIGRRSVITGAGSLLASSALVRAQSRSNGVALVIGNSKYQWESSLPNVKRDALDVARAFQALGLKTELLQDAGRDAMLSAIDRFKSAARGASLAAFYFAGHGVSWANSAYLIPVDANLGTPGEVQSLVSVATVNGAVADAAHRLLVFDNCRNNPADGWLQRKTLQMSRVDTSEYLALESRQPDTLTLFSTAPGHIALDGPPGENSPFAAALLRQFGGEKIDLQTLAPKLRRELLIATGCRQLLWDRSTYTTGFTIGGMPNGTVAARRETTGTRAEVLELPGVYTYARENGLILPDGLIAWRSAPGTPHADKIGSFTFRINVRSGGAGPNVPQLAAFIIMSVSDDNTAEAILTIVGANDGRGVRWRLLTCTISDNRLEFLSVGERTRLRLEWRDRNSGALWEQNVQDRTPFMHAMPVTRLDG